MKKPCFWKLIFLAPTLLYLGGVRPAQAQITLTSSVNAASAAPGDPITYILQYANASAPTTCSDGFEGDGTGAMPPGWTESAADWTVGADNSSRGTAGTRAVTGTAPNGQYPNLLNVCAGQVGDGAIQADLKIGAGGQTGVLLWRFTGTNNPAVLNGSNYQADISTGNTNNVSVDYYDNGTGTFHTVATGSYAVAAGAWSTVLFQVTGTGSGTVTLSLSINGTQVIAPAPATFSIGSGQAGLQVNSGSTVEFDNISIAKFTQTYNVTVTDTLPAGLTYVSASGAPSVSGSKVVWTLGNLANNASGSLTVSGTANSCGLTLIDSGEADSGLPQAGVVSAAVSTTLSACSATPTSTATASPTPTATPSPTFTATPTLTSTATLTVTPTFTSTATLTATSTATSTVTNTATPTATFTATPSATSTPSFTASPTFTNTQPPTATPTSTATSTVTNTATPTATSTVTFTATSSATSTPTLTASPTFTNTQPNTATSTSTATSTVTNTATLTATSTMTFTATSSATQTPTLTASPTFTNTQPNTATSTSTATSTVTNTATPTATSTVTFTATSSATSTPTLTASPTFTNTQPPTATPTSTATSTVTNTATLTATSTMTFTATSSATQTPTLTASPTFTNTQPNTATPTSTATSTVTNTATPTATSTVTFTATSSATPTPTLTASPTFTNTQPPTATPTSTATSTVTKTATPTATFTATSTLTKTRTATSTPTYTRSSTSTFTATRTPTGTRTPVLTPTSSATDTATLTATPSATDSSTPTESLTASPTASLGDCSREQVGIYDERGEWVQTLCGTLPQLPPQAIAFTVTAFTPNPSGKGGTLTLKVNGRTAVVWDATDAEGRRVPDGFYHLILTQHFTDGSSLQLSQAVFIAPLESDARVSMTAWPNPAHAGDTLRVAVFLGGVPADGKNLVRVYSLGGELLKTLDLVNGQGSWDLTNGRGEAVASGLYLLGFNAIDPGTGTAASKILRAAVLK